MADDALFLQGGELLETGELAVLLKSPQSAALQEFLSEVPRGDDDV